MSGYELKSDEELVMALRDGDDKITDYLLEKYKDLVRVKAKTMFIIGADKDDLIQEGMIGLYRAIRDYDPGRDASFYTFADLCISRQMYKAVEAGNRKKHSPLNTYISIYGENAARIGEEVNAGENNNVLEALWTLTGQSPEEHLIDIESAMVLEQKIHDALSKFELSVLSLHMTGMGYVEIARILGRDDKSVDNALSRIKIKVKKICEDHN